MSNSLELIPKVKVMSGKNGPNIRFFIDGKEILTVQDVVLHGAHGNLFEITVKFTGMVENDSLDGLIEKMIDKKIEKIK